MLSDAKSAYIGLMAFRIWKGTGVHFYPNKKKKEEKKEKIPAKFGFVVLPLRPRAKCESGSFFKINKMFHFSWFFFSFLGSYKHIKPSGRENM